jgi:AcrR family transcriptional regulator
MVVAQTELRTPTPARILDAAFESIRDFGLTRVTVEDVAQRARLSRQTVYRYFPSKDELIVALVSREEEKLLEGVRSVFVAHHDLETALKESTLFVLRYAREHPLLDRLLDADQATFLPYVTTRSLPVIVRARETMLELFRARVPEVDEETLRTILDGTTRAIVSYILTPSDRPVEAIATAMARALVTMLRKEASA